MAKTPAKPEKKRNIWREHALYFPLAAVLVTAFIVAALVLTFSCEAVKCESALTVFSSISAAYLVFCVCAIYTAHCFQLGGSEEERQKIINSALFFVASFLVIMGAIDAYNTNYYIGKEQQVELDAWIGGILAIWGLLLLGQRTKNQSKQLKIQTEQLKIQTQELENQNKQIKIQTNKEIDDRFIVAVKSLGSGESSARTGAVYFLYELAMESEKYRKQIAQILCSHIRSKTQEKAYQKDHTVRPSNEIQTTIDLLFKNINSVRGLYCQDFAWKNPYFPKANLSYAYLRGADFNMAQCQNVNFRYAQCQNVTFIEALCQRADFGFAKCHGSSFANAHCQNANFAFAQCLSASFFATKCYGANFSCSQCQDAGFSLADCQGANFQSAQCQGARFFNANFQGANLSSSAFQSVSFDNTNFCGAYTHTNFYDMWQVLESRIGQPTEVATAKFAGKWSTGSVKAIEDAKDYALEDWYRKMQELINESKKEPESYDVPEKIVTGVLEDGEEIRKIAEEIRKWQQ